MLAIECEGTAPSYEAGLADTIVSNEDDLEDVVVSDGSTCL